MDKVYAVHYDNGEPWEDGYSYTECIYKTREAAEAYLDKDYERHEGTRYDVNIGKTVPCVIWKNRKREEYVCSKGFTRCEGCPDYESWIDCEDEPEDYEYDVPCGEYDEMNYDYEMYPHEWWEIHEWDLLE